MADGVDHGESLDPEQEEARRERTRAQLEIIRAALEAEEGSDSFGFYTEGDGDNQGEAGDFQYLFRRERLLVRDEDVAQVRAILGDAEPIEETDDDEEDADADAEEEPGTGLQTLAVPDVTQALNALERVTLRTLATPDHLLYVAASPSCCPATKPEPVTTLAPTPSIQHVGSGCWLPWTSKPKDVHVTVVDTGFYQDAASHPVTGQWLSGVTGRPDQFPASGQIPAYGGHGTFIAGVVRCMAPSATVDVRGFLPTGGVVRELKIFRQVRRALQESPDIISLSAGTLTRSNKHLLGMERIWETKADPVHKTILVAAAGNDGADRPFYPAALPWVYSVGSIERDGRRSDFSNFGSWVDAYALGRNLVNAFPVGTYTCHEPENIHANIPEVRQFDNGLARWSGTSFSTPTVAGIIAARMSRTGETSRQAADVLFGRAKAQRGSTGGLAVIRPGSENLT